MKFIGKWASCVKPTKYMSHINKDNSEAHLRRYDKIVSMWEKNPTLKRFGWNMDGDQMLEHFNSATGKDPMLWAIDKADVKNFELYIKNYTSELMKGFDTKFVNWKILRDKLKNLPGGEDLTRGIQQVLGYQRRHNQINSTQLRTMQKTMQKLAKKFGVDLGELTDLEVQLSNATDPNTQARIEGEINKYLQGDSTQGVRQRAGDLHLGLTDVMQGFRPEDLMKTVDGQKVPWDGNEIKLAKTFQNAWYYIRKDMTKVAISALRTEKQTAKIIDKAEGGIRGLENYLNMLQDKIVELELSPKRSTVSKEYDFRGRELRELGARTEEQMSLNTELGYMPHHILTITSHLKEFNNYMHTPHEAPAEVKFKEVVGWYDKVKGSVGVDRLKSRNPNAEGYYSQNPFMFVSKYIYDISRYNHDVSMQKLLLNTSEKLMMAKDNATYGKYDQEVINITDTGFKLLESLSDEAFIGGVQGAGLKKTEGRPNNTFMNKMVRGLTTFQFLRTMGLGIRSAAKNLLGGKLLDYAKQGLAAKRFATQYLSNYDTMDGYNRQLEKVGLFWHKDGFGGNFTSEYAKAAATRGTYEEGVLPPGMAEKTVNGKQVLVVSDPTAFDKTLAVMERSATATSFMHQNIENILRPNVFRSNYAVVHSNLMAAPDSYIQYRMGRKKGDFESEQQWLERKANWIENQAGLEAFNMVGLTQFEYAKVAKANVLKTKTGATIGQYQHYRFSLASHMKQTYKDGYRAIKAGVLTGDLRAAMGSNVHSIEAYRMGMAYTLVGAAQFATGLGIMGLAQNDLFQLANQIGTIVSSDMDTDEGREAVEKATFGVGAVGPIIGPNLSFALEIGRVTGVMQENPSNRFLMLSLTEGEPLTETDHARKMRIARLFNIELARFGGAIFPSLMREQGNKAFKQQFGLFTSYDERKERHNTIKPYMQWGRNLFGISPPAYETRAMKPKYGGLEVGLGSISKINKITGKGKEIALNRHKERALEALKLF